MTNFALLGFALGVIAAAATLLILVPVRMQSVRAGAMARALALGAFALPLLGLLLLTPSRGPATSTDAVPPVQAPEGLDWSGAEDLALLPHVNAGTLPAVTGDANAAAMGANRGGHSVEELQAMTASDPGNARIWLALANAQRKAREYAAAAKSFDKALRIDSRNADAWADYADALASAGNRRLEGAPAEAIARALKLDSRHAKALWLQASLDLEQHRYAAALQHWQSLRAVLPSGSPDISIVEANIAEAQRLVAQPGGGR